MFYILMFLPVALSTVATIHTNWCILIVAVCMMYCAVAFSGTIRKFENLYMFILVFLTSIPINIKAVIQILTLDLWIGELLFLNILRFFVLYSLLLTVEELMFGYITRRIWKNQRKLIIDGKRIRIENDI